MNWKELDPTLAAVLERTPSIELAEILQIDAIGGGLSNRNFRIHTKVQQFIVRIAAENTMLGHDRQREHEAISRAEAHGIAPKLVNFILPQGHMISHYKSEARTLSRADMNDAGMLDRIAALLKKVHALAPISKSFDPYQDIRRWHSARQSRALPIPSRLPNLLSRVGEVEVARADVAKVLCHNDPYHPNFLDDGQLWLIDWEFAGMNDPMYDLAGVAYPIDRASRMQLLQSYYGDDGKAHINDLEDVIAVFICWNVFWCLVQTTTSDLDHDYQKFAEDLLDLVP